MKICLGWTGVESSIYQIPTLIWLTSYTESYSGIYKKPRITLKETHKAYGWARKGDFICANYFGELWLYTGHTQVTGRRLSDPRPQTAPMHENGPPEAHGHAVRRDPIECIAPGPSGFAPRRSLTGWFRSPPTPKQTPTPPYLSNACE